MSEHERFPQVAHSFIFLQKTSNSVRKPMSEFPALIVIDYANTVSTETLTTLTPCPSSQRLRQHHVRVLND